MLLTGGGGGISSGAGKIEGCKIGGETGGPEEAVAQIAEKTGREEVTSEEARSVEARSEDARPEEGGPEDARPEETIALAEEAGMWLQLNCLSQS